jgi:hypothetical protein
MPLFDFLYEEVADKAAAAPAKAGPVGPTRYQAPALNVVLDTRESGKTVSWGVDGLDISGIKQRFAANATTGGTVLEGVSFVGSFTAAVIAQGPDILKLKFTHTDKALAKRLAAGPVKPQAAPKKR